MPPVSKVAQVWVPVEGIPLALLFLAACAVTYFPSTRDRPILSFLFRLGLRLFGERGNFWAVTAGIGAHIVESVITVTRCRRGGMDARGVAWWLAMTLLMGYPALRCATLATQQQSERAKCK